VKANQKAREKLGITPILGTLLMIPIIAVVITFMTMWANNLIALMKNYGDMLNKIADDLKDLQLDFSILGEDDTIIWSDNFEDIQWNNPYGEFNYWDSSLQQGIISFDSEYYNSPIHSLKLETNPSNIARIGKELGGRPSANKISMNVAFTVSPSESSKIFRIYEKDHCGIQMNIATIKIDIGSGDLSLTRDLNGAPIIEDFGNVYGFNTIQPWTYWNNWNTVELVIDLSHTDSGYSHYVSFDLNGKKFDLIDDDYLLESYSTTETRPKSLLVEIESASSVAGVATYIDDFVLRDLSGDSDSNNAAVNLICDSPIANDDTDTTTEGVDININVLNNDNWGTDGPGTTAITIPSGPTDGTATVNDGGTPSDPTDDTIDYTPDALFTGTDTLTYQIEDADGDTDTATVTITVISLPWPMFHHDARRTGLQSGTANIASPLLKWMKSIGPEICESSPALGDVDNDGTIEVITVSSGVVYCLDGNTGNIEWFKSVTIGVPMACTSPAIGDIDKDGNVEILVYSHDNYLYCLDGSNNGFKKWEYKVGNLAMLDFSSPVIGNVDSDIYEEVIIGSDDGIVYCLSAFGAKKWERSIGAGLYIQASPAIGDVDNDGNIEVIIGRGSTIYCLNGVNGNQKWSYATGGETYTSAIGNIDADAYLEIIVCNGINKKVYCLNGYDGARQWDYTSTYGTYNCPSIGDVDNDGSIEIIGYSSDCNVYNSKVFCLNSLGTEEWTKDFSGYVIQPCTVLGDIDNDVKLEIIFGTFDNIFYCLEGENGNIKWQYTTSDYTTSSAAVGDVDNDGNLEIIIVNNNGDIYCIDSTGNSPPTAADKTVTTPQDTPYTFAEADYTYFDFEGAPMNHIEIININKPAGSTLQLSGINVNNGDTITTAQIPNLVFTPAAGASGANYATYNFRVNDGTQYSILTYTITIDVNSPATGWIKRYEQSASGINYIRGSNSHQTADGGYIIGGYIENDINERTSCIIKVDSNGNFVWSKIYDLNGVGDDDYIEDIKPILNSAGNHIGYIVAGFTDYSAVGQSGFILRTDLNGNPLWIRVLYNNFGRFETVCQSFDAAGNPDGFVAGGEIHEATVPFYNGFVKVDNNGNVVWIKCYADSNEDHQSCIYGIIQTSDNGYLARGKVTGKYNFVIKLNSQGNILWANDIDDSSVLGWYAGFSFPLTETSDGYYLVGTTTDLYGAGKNDALFLKLNTNGNIFWSKTLGKSEDDAIYDIIELSDGSGFILAGMSQSLIPIGWDSGLIMKVDNNFDFIWAKDTIGSEAARVKQTSDSGFIMMSSTIDTFLAKFDENGNIGCCNYDETVTGFTISNHAVNYNSLGWSTQTKNYGLINAAGALSVSNLAINIIQICPNC